jgi:hypothetical protein
MIAKALTEIRYVTKSRLGGLEGRFAVLILLETIPAARNEGAVSAVANSWG